MAFFPVTVLPGLRPWRSAGLRVLLFDAETAAALREAAGPSKSLPERPPVRAEARPPFAENDSRSVARRPQGDPGRQGAPTEDQRFRRNQAEPARPPRPCPERTDPPARADVPAGGVQNPGMELSLWLPFWRDLLRRTPPRPTLLWTYPGLGRDLDGHADAAHRTFLRRLLQDMAMPKGSHAFWPLDRHTADADGPIAADAGHFLGGVAVLKPDAVLLLTGTPPTGLGLDGLRPLQPALVGGRRFVLMPHVDQLIREPGQYVRLITFLKALLGPRA